MKGATRQQTSESLSFPWRRLFSTCIGIALVVGLIVGGRQLFSTLDQPLKHVSVSGQLNHLSVTKIEKMVQGRVAEGLFAADLDEVRKILVEEPWLERVAVRRKWPNLLHIDLIEREPYLRWNVDQLMTSEGVVFKPEEGVAQFELPVLLGDFASRYELLSRYNWLNERLIKEGVVVARLQKEQRGAWRVQLAEGPWIYLGRDAIEEKVIRFMGLYREVLRSRILEIERVDLRYTHGVSVSWKENNKAAAILRWSGNSNA